MEHGPAREIDLRAGRAWGPNRHTEAGVRFRAKLIAHLRAAGYPAYDESPPDSGGRAVSPYDPANPAHLQEAGGNLARYHELVRSFPHRFRAAGRPALPSLERSGPYALACFTEVAEGVLGSADRARLTRASSFLWSQFIRVPETLTGVLHPLPQLVIHGSYDPTALSYQGDRIAAVTGYDHAAYDLRALDLGHALRAFAGVEETGGPQADVGLDIDRCAALMAGYGEVETLPAHELAVLPLVFRARHLAEVLTETADLLSRPEDAGRLETDVHDLLDAVERGAEQSRWLEREEPALLSALSSSRVG
jgi:Ser/Thr protein kinase RdoA (MazF antagonist)